VLTLLLRYYCLSILDKHHNPNIDFEQGMKLLSLCTDELKRRLPVDFKGVRYSLYDIFNIIWPVNQVLTLLLDAGKGGG
jgi:hypothetical protein